MLNVVVTLAVCSGATCAAETSSIIPFEKTGCNASIIAKYGMRVGGIKATIRSAPISMQRRFSSNITPFHIILYDAEWPAISKLDL